MDSTDTPREGTAGLSLARRVAIGLAIAALALFALNIGGLVTAVRHVLAGDWVLDDTYQYVWTYLSRDGALIFADDPIAQYFRFAHAPQGFDVVYAFLGERVDIRQAAVAINMALYGMLFAFMVLTGRCIAGPAGGWVALFLTLASEYLLIFMNAGIPRSFGPPLAAMTLYGLVSGRLWLAALATVLGAVFYYMVAVMGGLALAVTALLPRLAAGPVRPAGLPARLGLVAVTGVLALAILASSVTREHGYGAVLGPESYDSYPEAGPDGRYFPQWSGPIRDFADTMIRSLDNGRWPPESAQGALARGYNFLDRAVFALHGPMGLALLVAVTAGVVAFRARGVGAILAMAGVAMALFVAAVQLFPLMFFPDRFYQPVVPLVTVLLLSWLGVRLLERFAPRLTPAGQTGALVTVAALGLLAMGRPIWTEANGFDKLDPARAELYAFLRTLPEDAVIAGWPREAAIDGLPHFAERRILVGYETQQSVREGYVQHTRARMETVIEAFVAGEPAAFERLRTVFGVTHVLASAEIYDRERIGYYAPYDARLAEIPDHGAGYARLRSGRVGETVYERDGYLVVALPPAE